MATAGMPDTSTIDTYGGVLVNYEPVVDPTTDRDAGAMDQALEDCAEMTQTACRAWARFTLASSTGAIVLVDSNAGWGNTVPPTMTRLSPGVFVAIWPATVTDGLGNVHALNFRWAKASIESVTTFGFANAAPYQSCNAALATADVAGSANDLAGATVLIRVG